jgi:hypothetical protein
MLVTGSQLGLDYLCPITCQWSDIDWGYEGESRESDEEYAILH